ncbi:MAG: S1 family peptidase, partial [Thermoleophilia bacterium]|nr:S1 family peptidase [Thermoleophilia bacterium]
MVAQDGLRNPLWRCSGTLLSPTVFLTAGHCTSGAAHVEVWFAADVDAGRPANGYPFTGDVGGTPYTHPEYPNAAFVVRDVGVVVLRQPEDAPRRQGRPLHRRRLRAPAELPRRRVVPGEQHARAHGGQPAAAADQHARVHRRLLDAALEQRE